MLIKNLYAKLLDNPLPDVVYLQCHDKKRGRPYNKQQTQTFNF